jgi:acetyl esterase/lipase
MRSVLSAYSPVSVLNAIAPKAGIVATHDVRYASGNRQELDIYAPEGQNSAPVVVFIHGGGWMDGDKSLYRFVAAALAARGFLTVVPNYRLFPEVGFPIFLQDNAAAVAWTRSNIAWYGGDKRRLFLMGHSAGAYNAAMLTLDKQWLGAEGLDPDRDIAGTVGLAGPYDFLPLHSPSLEQLFAAAGQLRLTQPISFARGDAPPMLLSTGAADQRVLPDNTHRLAEAIRRRGGRVEERTYPGINHTRIIGAMAGVLRWLAPSMRDVSGFLGRHAGWGVHPVAGSWKGNRIVEADRSWASGSPGVRRRMARTASSSDG